MRSGTIASALCPPPKCRRRAQVSLAHHPPREHSSVQSCLSVLPTRQRTRTNRPDCHSKDRQARPGRCGLFLSPVPSFRPSGLALCWAKNNTQSRPTGPRGIVSFSCFGPSRPLSPTYKTAEGGRASPHRSAVASFEPRRAPEPTSREGLRSSGPRARILVRR